MSFYLIKRITDLALHHSDLESVIVLVIGDPVMDLGRSRSLLAFLLVILIIRAAGAAGAGILSNEHPCESQTSFK